MSKREYIIKRSADVDEEPDGEDYLSRTVIEDYELVDIGVMDSEGNQIMARKKMDQIGYINFERLKRD